MVCTYSLYICKTWPEIACTLVDILVRGDAVCIVGSIGNGDFTNREILEVALKMLGKMCRDIQDSTAWHRMVNIVEKDDLFALTSNDFLATDCYLNS